VLAGLLDTQRKQVQALAPLPASPGNKLRGGVRLRRDRLAARVRARVRRTARFRGTLDRRLHLRERVAEFRTRRNRELELTSAMHTYQRPGRYAVAVKVIDIFGSDTMTLVPVNVG
jgi:hypothetical protein